MNCDILKIVRGNDFATQMTITALDAGGNVIEDFSLEDSTEVVVKYTLAGDLHTIEAYDYDIEGNDITIQWSDLALGKYGFEIEGKFNGYSWRSAARFIFQIVADNASANIPDGVLVNGIYILNDWLRLLSGIGGGIKQVQADWTETDTEAPSYIQHKPELAPVATSGSYNDLTNKPTIPDVSGKADKVSGAVSGDFAALDANGNLTDSGKKASDFATAAQGAKADTAIQDISGKQDVLVSGTNIKTINNESILGSGNITIEGGGAVDSVNGQTGVVVLDAEDVGAATAAQGAKADTALQPSDVDSAMSDTSENPVQNKVVKEAIDDKLSEVTINAIPAGSIAIINDLITGGETNSLSAEMGKLIKYNVQTILDALGEYAFPSGKPEISWEGDVPYDSRVEYLEGTGTQYIDTGIKPTASFTFDTKIAVTQSSYNCVFWGCRSYGDYRTENSQCYCNSNSTTGEDGHLRLYTTAAELTTNWDSGIAPQVNTIYTFTNMTCVPTMLDMTQNITLFGFNVLGSVNASLGKCRIARFTAYNNGVKVIDLIPVRVGTTGYMYDTVSGELFGNDGTGAFNLGNDI